MSEHEREDPYAPLLDTPHCSGAQLKKLGECPETVPLVWTLVISWQQWQVQLPTWHCQQLPEATGAGEAKEKQGKPIGEHK